MHMHMSTSMYMCITCTCTCTCTRTCARAQAIFILLSCVIYVLRCCMRCPRLCGSSVRGHRARLQAMAPVNGNRKGSTACRHEKLSLNRSDHDEADVDVIDL